MIILHEIWLIVRYGYAKGAHSYLEAHKRYSLELFMKKKSLELLIYTIVLSPYFVTAF